MRLRNLLLSVLLVLLASGVAHAQAWNDNVTTLHTGARALYEFTTDTDSGGLHVGRNASVVYGFDQDTVGTDTDADAAILTCPAPTTAVASCIVAVHLTEDISGGVITPAHEWIRIRVDVAPGSGSSRVTLQGSSTTSISTEDPTFTGTATFDAINVVSSDPEGGSTLVKECKNDPAVAGGTNCPDPGQENTFDANKICDDCDPLAYNKEKSPGWTQCWGLRENVSAVRDGDYCVMHTFLSSTTPQDCTADNGALTALWTVPFTNGVRVDTCRVHVTNNSHTNDSSVLALQLEVWDLEDDPHARIAIGTVFQIRDNSGNNPCGVTENCIDGTANVPGVVGWDVSGGDDASQGYLQLNIDSTSIYTSGNLNGYARICCDFY